MEILPPEITPGGFHGKSSGDNLYSFSKIVPWNYYMGFNEFGIPISWRDYEETEKYYGLVQLRCFYDYSEKQWYIILGVYDDDDLCYQRFELLTKENWQELYRIYNEELVIPEALDWENLEQLGFK